jgi:hypothetical protein
MEAMKTKLFRVTRATRVFVWVRWISYGMTRRGLSVRYSRQDFKRLFLPVAKQDGLDEQFYFRRTL